jgi:hypothetical protein
MCHPTRCRVCGGTTWAGCGQHVAQVKSMVPRETWCDKNHTAEERTAAGVGTGFFSKLLGR